MPPELLDLSPAERLRALRELDEFHPWGSIAEKRLCCRCDQVITGREIQIFGARSSREPSRLECPTEGCPSVPIEWMMLESAEELHVQPVAPAPQQTRANPLAR